MIYEGNFTDRARLALRMAIQEAARVGANKVTAAHLLIGILKAGDTPAQEILLGAGITLNLLRNHSCATDYCESKIEPGEVVTIKGAAVVYVKNDWFIDDEDKPLEIPRIEP